MVKSQVLKCLKLVSEREGKMLKWCLTLLQKETILSTSEILNTHNKYIFFDYTFVFKILCLSKQSQRVFVYWKSGLKAGFKDFWCTNIYNHQIHLK